jgi:chemotaxis protein MotB
VAKNNDDKIQPIIIKKVKKVEGGHHGGAWKVAYADFVTAMMAFFLLLWLLSVTTDTQKAQISAYFAPADPRVAQTLSGAGGVMGGTSMSKQGAMSSQSSPVSPSHEPMDEGKTQDDAKQDAATDKQDEQSFAKVEDQIKQAMQSAPDLAAMAQNLLVDQTPEGLRIQIVDQEGKPMFELGSAKPLPQAVRLLNMLAHVVKELPNKISIRGHTDSRPYGKDAAYTNWELSSDRANASRRVMLEGGLSIARVENVQGKADREPLVPADPEAAKNRRISIILLKQSVVAGIKRAETKKASGAGTPPEPKKHEKGVIYFP